MARTNREHAPGIEEQAPLELAPDAGMVRTRNFGIPITTITAANSPYTPTGREEVILADATAGAVTVLMPAAVVGILTNNINAHYRVLKIDASGNAVTVQRSGADALNGGTGVNTTAQYKGFDCYATAVATWLAIGAG